MNEEFLMFFVGIPVVMVSIALITSMLILVVNKFFPSNAELSRRTTEERMKALAEGAARGECMSLIKRGH